MKVGINCITYGKALQLLFKLFNNVSLDMRNQIYEIRNYQPSDFEAYVRLHVESEKTDRSGYCVSSRIIEKKLSQPNCCPDQDLFLAEIEDGNIAAFIFVQTESNINRAVFSYLIHHDHRDGDLLSKLFDVALNRAFNMGAEIVHVNVQENNQSDQQKLSKLGFRPVRCYMELCLDLLKFDKVIRRRGSYLCHHLECGGEAQLAELQNRSFAGDWGYNPNTAEDIVWRSNMGDCCPEGILMVWEGNNPVSYCWTTVDEERNKFFGINIGRVYMMGVDPGYRRKGVGRLALLLGLSYLKDKGIDIVELTVDSENKKARALYKSVGFNVKSNSMWYEKALY